jgi:hypothetical protein
MSRVFISHSSHDRDVVEREVIEPLRKHGVETWYSKDKIKTAADWERSIWRGLNQCEWFLVVLTPRAVESYWVRSEVAWALTQRRGRVIPVMLEACDPAELYLGLQPIQHIDFSHDTEQARARLLDFFDSGDEPEDISPLTANRTSTLRRVVLTAIVITVLLFATMSMYWFSPWSPQTRRLDNAPVKDNASAATTATRNGGGANPLSSANASHQGNKGGPTVTFTPLPERISLPTAGGNK